jgi:hypothetical protein
VRQDLPHVAQIESGLGDVDVELCQVAVVPDGDLECGLGCLDSGPGFLERLVLGQSFDEVDPVLRELLDTGASLINFGLKAVDFLKLLQINWASLGLLDRQPLASPPA